MRRSRPKRQDIANLLRHAVSLGLSRDASKRLTWFSYALAHEGNVSLACRYFGISRTTFLRWANRFDPRKPETLEERSRRPHHVREPQVDHAVVEWIRQYRLQNVTMGKEQIARKLTTEHQVIISASSVGRVIARNGFFFADRQSHASKRVGVDFSPTAIDTTASSVSMQDVGEAGVKPVLSPDEGPADQLPLFGS